jgi:hypothetical protein
MNMISGSGSPSIIPSYDQTEMQAGFNFLRT